MANDQTAGPRPGLNWKRLGEEGFYIVRTQAGFKHALRDFRENVGGDPGMESRGYPTSYPSVVHLSLGYTGSTWVRVACIHFNDLMVAMQESDA